MRREGPEWGLLVLVLVFVLAPASLRCDCRDRRGVAVAVRGRAWQGSSAAGGWPEWWGDGDPGHEHEVHDAAHKEDARQVRRHAQPGAGHSAPREEVACDSSEVGEVRVGAG